MVASASSNPAYVIRQQGFSLLEVLVAFVVMGLVVGTLLQMYGASMRGVSVADDISYAVQVAESKLAQVGTEINVEEGEERGEIEDTHYRWEVIMEPVELLENSEDFSLSVQPFSVIVRVLWGEGRRERVFELKSIRFGENL